MRLHRLPLLSACLPSLVFVVMSVGPVHAQEAVAPSDPAVELARAEKLKSEAAGLRSAADARFNADEIACYERFLVNRCIDEARARRVADVRKTAGLLLPGLQLQCGQLRRTTWPAHQLEQKRPPIVYSTHGVALL